MTLFSSFWGEYCAVPVAFTAVKVMLTELQLTLNVVIVYNYNYCKSKIKLNKICQSCTCSFILPTTCTKKMIVAVLAVCRLNQCQSCKL